MYSKTPHSIIPALIGALLSAPLIAAAADLAPASSAENLSIRNEVKHAIGKGLDWLATHQNPTNGSWSTTDYPALTALPLTAFMGDPGERYRTNPVVANGYKFLLAHVQPDGGIYAKDLPNYNTSISLMALVAAHNPEYDPIIRHARQWIIGEQTTFTGTNSVFDGGIGYGSDKQHRSDMNNTLVALEALYYSKSIGKDKPISGDTNSKELDMAAAIKFLQNCQNLPGTNVQSWVSGDPADKGGFVYSPEQSKAGQQTNSAGRVTFRSYGSISYAGLLSYIYADLKHNDPRVEAVFKWLQSNVTLEENPGMGQEGYYYYLHMMSKGLAAYGVNEIELKNGKKINWRKEVALKLIDLQKTDGSWINASGRWLEKDPVLVTAYSVMALEFVYSGL